MTYTKRVGFIVSHQTLIPHGGIGQFALSFSKMMDTHGILVDIITDKEPSALGKELMSTTHSNIIYPKQPLAYTDHSAIFMYEDSYCYERMVNLRNAIIHALEKNIYDVFVCNTYESIQVVQNLGLTEYIQTIAYTHLESQIFKTNKNPFSINTNDMMRSQLTLPGLYIGTQSKFNQLQFAEAWHLPIPLSEVDLLNEYNGPRNGVLFVGRWEAGKNPDLFIKLIEQTGLPARVMTSPTSAPKFESALKKIGCTDYVVKSGVVGTEKTDFIKQCRVAFNPSLVESYGLAFLEQQIQLPTFALANQRWTSNFDCSRFFTTTETKMKDDVLAAYDKYHTAEEWYKTKSIDFFSNQEATIFLKWKECFDSFTPKQSNSSTAKICKEQTVRHDEYIRDLNRRIICIDDVKSVLANKHKFVVIHTNEYTYLTKDKNFAVPTDTSTMELLFDGF